MKQRTIRHLEPLSGSFTDKPYHEVASICGTNRAVETSLHLRSFQEHSQPIHLLLHRPED